MLNAPVEELNASGASAESEVLPRRPSEVVETVSTPPLFTNPVPSSEVK